MASQSVTITAPSSGGTFPIISQAIVLDLKKFQSGEGMGVICTISTGATANYTVQVTGDNPFVAAPTNWNALDGMSALNASTNSNLAFPATCIRLSVASLTPGGSVTMSVVSTDI